MEEHLKTLKSLCRICTKRLGRVSYPVSYSPAGESKSMLEECFGLVDTNPNTCPPRFCNTCYLTMCRIRKALRDRVVYRSSLSLHTWTEHKDEVCSTCSMVEKRKIGGRPKSNPPSIQGCPKHLCDHIKSIAGPR